MDVRRSGNPMIRAVSSGLRWFNARHPWSHNDRFHGWILRRPPRRRRRALDVGCGTGLLVSRLAGTFDEVVGIDADATMAVRAAQRLAGSPGVTIRHQRLQDVTGRFDLVTFVASLHHMPLEEGLRHAGDLVAPGGRLRVVGVARPATPVDLAYDVASALLNPLVGLVKHPRAVRTPGPSDPTPVRDATESVDEIARVARRVLPGAVVRRRLFFRYTLEWGRPTGRLARK
ncbi:class I SAM-dependent methyltransferase [Georgenia alba]|uniref:Class I SAM-dependent methyltransferase n=1 Tax=Georgenia alba TaxID=2233858 RepID=A0ABW2QC55_9MICO